MVHSLDLRPVQGPCHGVRGLTKGTEESTEVGPRPSFLHRRQGVPIEYPYKKQKSPLTLFLIGTRYNHSTTGGVVI